jgi:D-amino peptidase
VSTSHAVATCLIALLLAITPAAPNAARQAGPRVLLLYDMEGVSGAVAGADVSFGSDTYPATRESLTEDVNAAIRGLLKAGAAEVVLTDGHGSGSPNPDYMLEKLPAGATFDLRDVPYDPYIETMSDRFEAMVAIAMHGRAGGQAFLAHTYNGHTKWVMAGHDMNESMLVAASAARFNIPLVLVTGDDVLQKEIAAFSPKTEYVVVKRAVSIERAESRPRAEVSRDIEAAAERAFRQRKAVDPWRPAAIRGEFENLYGYILPEMAAVAINFPGAEVVDNKTVRVRTRSFLEAYLAFRGLAAFTGYASQRMVVGYMREDPDGRAILQKAQQRLPSRTERTFAPTGTSIPRGFGKHGYQ